jgi:hypothetical protein
VIATFLAVPDLNLFGTCVAPVSSCKSKRATAARRCAAQRSSRIDGRVVKSYSPAKACSRADLTAYDEPTPRSGKCLTYDKLGKPRRLSVSHDTCSVEIIVSKSAKETIFYECTSKDSCSR